MILFCGAFLAFLISRLSPNKGLAGCITACVSLVLALASLAAIFVMLRAGAVVHYPVNLFYYFAAVRFDHLSLLLGFTAVILALMVAIYSYRYMEHDLSQDKYYPLLLIMTGAIVGLGASTDLFNMWVFFELMCVASYILVSFRKERWESLEAGFKYIVMSATGSMCVLLGIAIVFGYTGSLDLLTLKTRLMIGSGIPLAFAAVLFIAGFSVKAALVPFHSWLPDAHSEAPSGISAMLSGVVIETGLFALLKTLFALYFLGLDTGSVLIVLGVISMFFGNLMALSQKRIKRMLAYSSIAQMGYIVLGIGIGMHYLSVAGMEGGLFHVITHAGMKGLAFLAAGAAIHYCGTVYIDDLSGLSKKMPILALVFAVACLGLAGVPPLSGFMSKWMIYLSGITAGGKGYILSAFAIFNSVLSLGYYLPAINRMYSSKQSGFVTAAKHPPVSVMAPLVLLALSVIALGVWPDLGLFVVNGAVGNAFGLMGVLK